MILIVIRGSNPLALSKIGSKAHDVLNWPVKIIIKVFDELRLYLSSSLAVKPDFKFCYFELLDYS